MKLVEVRIDRTKSLGNYENIKLGFTAVIEESESAVDAVERVKDLMDWEINRDERDAQYNKFKSQIAKDELNGDLDKVQRWIDKYETREAELRKAFLA